MRKEHLSRSPEIDCQLDEILLCLSSGIPEEHVMRRIGISYDDWIRYKVDRFHTLSPLFPPSASAARKHTPYIIERRAFKPAVHHMRKFLIAP